MSFFSSVGSLVGSSTAGRDVMDTIGKTYGLYGLDDVWVALGTGIKTGMDKGYRPRQWKGGLNVLQMVMLDTNIGGLFFDAIIHTDIEEQLTITSHPVQTGANISDHAYREPSRVTMEVFMSDVMASRLPGQFTDAGMGFLSGVDVASAVMAAGSRSVSAYQRLKELQRAKVPFSVYTRLGVYKNMMIENISTPDDANTANGLRCTVSMREVLLAQVATTKVSAREWTTSRGTQKGETHPQTPTSVLRSGEILASGGGFGGGLGG